MMGVCCGNLGVHIIFLEQIASCFAFALSSKLATAHNSRNTSGTVTWELYLFSCWCGVLAAGYSAAAPLPALHMPYVARNS